VTKPAEGRRCRWCGRGIDPRPGPGRPRQYCRQSCRQADYVARQRSAEVGLSEHELIVAREALDGLRDRIYELEAAIEDVERDLEHAESEAEVRDALAWLLQAARPLVAAVL
jgi:hypothetical protein